MQHCAGSTGVSPPSRITANLREWKLPCNESSMLGGTSTEHKQRTVSREQFGGESQIGQVLSACRGDAQDRGLAKAKTMNLRRNTKIRAHDRKPDM